MNLYSSIVLAALLSLAASRPESPKLKLPDLGADSFIVGGSEAEDGQFPSLLSIEYLGSNGWTHICGAVLYKNKYALTAAHCVDRYSVANLRVLAGTLDRSNPAATAGEIHPVLRYYVHTGYAPGTPGVPNNIAVITFIEPADTTHPNIDNAILPTDPDNDFHHGGCFVVGYGRTVKCLSICVNDASTGGPMSNVIRWLQIPVITNPDCEARVAQVEHTALFPNQICVLSDPPGRGPCNGDAGGPLFCYATETDTSTLYLAGIFSWNVAVSGNCNLQYPSVSNRVTSYLDWIEANTP